MKHIILHYAGYRYGGIERVFWKLSMTLPGRLGRASGRIAAFDYATVRFCQQLRDMR